MIEYAILLLFQRIILKNISFSFNEGENWFSVSNSEFYSLPSPFPIQEKRTLKRGHSRERRWKFFCCVVEHDVGVQLHLPRQACPQMKQQQQATGLVSSVLK
jgi:hypothetical protein